MYSPPSVSSSGSSIYGNDYYYSGRNIYRKNSIQDLYACLDYLYNKNICTPERTALHSCSAGGILVGIHPQNHYELNRKSNQLQSIDCFLY